jgi:hypothetical protein
MQIPGESHQPLQSLKGFGLLCAPGEAASGVEEAMRATAEAITQCKFEATDPAADEVVLYKILQVAFLS